MTKHEHAYATAAVIRRVIKTVESTGLLVGGLKLHPDGKIEIIPLAPDRTPLPANDFDRLNAEGVL